MTPTSFERQQEAIFGPFFGLILWTMLVWIYVFYKRIPLIQKLKLTPKQMQTPGELMRLSPSDVTNPADNFRNLFEVPVLFYALTIYLFVTRQVDNGFVTAAWIFLVFRVLHSIVHCSYNHVPHRFYCYFASCVAFGYMAIRASLSYFLS